MTLSADEFIRRFLLHVLPNGCRRIRYYGFLANLYRREKLAQCRQLFGMRAAGATAGAPPPKDYHDRYAKNSPVARCRNARSAIGAAW